MARYPGVDLFLEYNVLLLLFTVLIVFVIFQNVLAFLGCGRKVLASFDHPKLTSSQQDVEMFSAPDKCYEMTQEGVCSIPDATLIHHEQTHIHTLENDDDQRRQTKALLLD